MTEYSNAHDRLLRDLSKSTCRPLTHWFSVLESAGVHANGFLGALELLDEEHDVPHDLATAIAWAYFNPSVVPDDLMVVESAAAASQLQTAEARFLLTRRTWMLN